ARLYQTLGMRLSSSRYFTESANVPSHLCSVEQWECFSAHHEVIKITHAFPAVDFLMTQVRALLNVCQPRGAALTTNGNVTVISNGVIQAIITSGSSTRAVGMATNIWQEGGTDGIFTAARDTFRSRRASAAILLQDGNSLGLG